MWGMDGGNYVGTIINLGGMTIPDVEMVELQYPATVLTHEFWQDSGGPGKWRGGLGIHWVDRINADGRTVVYGDGKKNPPYGLFGGEPGRGSIPYVISDGKRIEPPTKAVLFVKAGDIHDHYEGGGGGYGNPLARDPELVRWDVINEYVSIGAARESYGVVVDLNTLQVDYEATRRLREERGQGRHLGDL
jgi:N-methylhydantoinase B